MRLKEFITRSGGVITAIALLVSMMSMAGAAAPDGFYNCCICGETFDYNTNVTNTQTYQEMYNGEYVCQSCLEKKIAEYKAANSGTISSPGTGKTPVTLTAAASTFNVTVPTSIPLVVGANSKVTSPSDVKIINNSAGPVKVTAIAMNDGVWTMTDYNGGDRSKLAAEKVGSNKLGLSLTAGGNTVASSKNGSQSPAIDSTKWRLTGKNTGNNGLPITVGAIASAVSTKIENAVTAANVVFTVAWDK